MRVPSDFSLYIRCKCRHKWVHETCIEFVCHKFKVKSLFYREYLGVNLRFFFVGLSDIGVDVYGLIFIVPMGF